MITKMQNVKRKVKNEKRDCKGGYQPPCRRSFISDTSSLILLAKADLLPLFCKNAKIFITQAVKEETIFASKDSCLIQALIDSGSIDVREQKAIDKPFSLHRGERTVIALFQRMGADYLLLDDKKAALYCRRHAIPYVNALLIPRYLRQYKIIDDQTMHNKIALLSGIGHYAGWIKTYVNRHPHAF